MVTSAGRRVSLVRAFQAELKKRYPDSKVFASDANPDWSAACRVSDKFFKSPRISDSAYISFLIELCLENEIGLVIPTVDTELLKLSEHRSVFESNDINLIVSDEELVVKCRDKRLTNNLFNNLGIVVPKSVDKFNRTYPLFIKPYDGSLSQGIQLVRTENDWRDSFLYDDKLMFMEYLDPMDHQEYTVDAYYSKNSQLISLVPRKRVEVRGGEISKGLTEKNNLYSSLVETIGNLKGARGCLTIQFFINRKNKGIIGIEINPRFGGGFPLSYSAGANFPGWLIDEYLTGMKLEFQDSWVDGMAMVRYDAEIIFENGTRNQ